MYYKLLYVILWYDVVVGGNLKGSNVTQILYYQCPDMGQLSRYGVDKYDPIPLISDIRFYEHYLLQFNWQVW